MDETQTPGPQDHQEASALWLEEAEDMRAAQGDHVTLDQALAFSVAYALQALLLAPQTLTQSPDPEPDPFGWPQPGDVDPATIDG